MSVKVKVRAGESIDMLVRRLRKAVEREGMHRDVKRKEFYEKPSEIKRRKRRQNERKNVKQDKKFFIRIDQRKIN